MHNQRDKQRNYPHDYKFPIDHLSNDIHFRTVAIDS